MPMATYQPNPSNTKGIYWDTFIANYYPVENPVINLRTEQTVINLRAIPRPKMSIRITTGRLLLPVFWDQIKTGFTV